MMIENWTLMTWLNLAGFNISEERIQNLKKKEKNQEKGGFMNNFISPYLAAAFR